MKISYADFEKTMRDKLERDGGKSQLTMINGGIMNLWLSDSKNGIINSRYSSLNCEFKILYAIYEKAVSLGGEMYLGANAAQNGQKIGGDGFPVDTIDAFISINFYGKKIGDKTMRRSTYYAAILDWAGFVTNNRGGTITIKKEFMSEDS
ncbi:MAG TPA: hypothetical protein H9729_04140 [Candidatus Borkfalkia excrementigallinarum]|uniref:Uncharacterized protein n=1 Tax=Candidatus Borkfalkia excrementigallinarum TaxID=2838506 RepID=A0A9D2CSN7_9FIRM|nr:hypothetical protein [Candidatus Borkfalkia excrementigallinarum]